MLFLYLFFLLLKLGHCYNIFVYATQVSHSHVMFLNAIADTLAEAGHNVVMYSLEYSPSANFKYPKRAHTIVKPRSVNIDVDLQSFIGGSWEDTFPSPLSIFKITRGMGINFSKMCRSVLEDTAMIEHFRKTKFDLGISESFDICAFIYYKKIGVGNYVTADAIGLSDPSAERAGIDNNPSFIPTLLAPFSDEMTYWQRVVNLALLVTSKFTRRYIFRRSFQNELWNLTRRNYDIPESLLKRTFIFVNSDEYLEFIRPLTHKVVYISGIGIRQPKQLEGNYKNIMDNATNGAVFVSFGSVMKSEWMPSKLKNAFVAAFRKFPKIQFIWKYEADDNIGNDLPNLMKVKWAPQIDLLAHPNLKAFITHGGINSINEATRAGVPAIVIPLFSDQFRNSKMVQKRGVACLINKRNITEESLVEALHEILSNKRYQTAAKRLQQLILNKPVNASERLIKHVEFAAKFGYIENLDCAATKLSFMQYYLLDIVVPFAFIIVFCFCSGVFLCFVLGRKLFSTYKLKAD